MGTPHKYAALIKAWADGAKIQLKSSAGWIDTYNSNWDGPAYRIKPTPIKYRLFIQKLPLGDTTYIQAQTEGDDTDPESLGSSVRWLGDWQEVEV